ncbi:MAG: 7-cyano-7-deazaguanine reductase [Candidatus Lloydbacteria bacterium RIFCSPHIGHO2_02_FULL_54_17]|uniref:7-cyano-7-deazaguanine reductase n=1 Tax=Candidatus Lloydbacteria bacterium RIFCSPHIGHO2_02_FULL_54_17 TaxID=1798664 RepID=A0A1G2DGW8_9BACT|nr:MAG: 7-cyano-7-deazaguanine reductase [Candidatus Lloydbacteria bacterium RIFCSPHIGHO2_01_FULL_54_11]OGZ12826.1 MAG: 7-cyano-7-deazaguanine reductase [Candidatus Lloydbacteria bacterium RIFCSPHIGHO2_02_FULL_54_17]OGZ14846.1 MAG: 7-cyano-7-deazaguanine reductase [Candidatus Lloydbacteria bacterium RIFCSPLOWO2_01_FULL_54_18]OGZ16846.1 MAG: 7-cyano-7-deazaguanine reductase [Candidatus Lloydbacteria bacterium RIFCSPLOWO2_02_FULL_54_12]
MKLSQAKKVWSDSSILKSIPNPSKKGYEIKIKNPEVTFLGVNDQPDFTTIFLTFYPSEKVIELRSLKKYFQQFRNSIVSYERLINVIYDDLVKVYEPERLRIVMTFAARGGLSSRLAIDSDWKVRGGKEQFRDWIGQREEW